MDLGHDRSGRGQTHNLIAGDNIIVNGGNLTSIQNVYPSPPSNQQVLALKTLYPRNGSPKIDGRLLHNSKAYEAFRRSPRHAEVDSHSERMIYVPGYDSANNSIQRHELYHPFRRNYSRAIALSVAHRLADQDALLASIILPSSSQSSAQYIVPTLAYQLVQNIPPTAEYILTAIQHDPCIFERDTETQFRQLVERPLMLASKQASPEEILKWPPFIVVDGNAHQFSPGSVPQQIVHLLSTLSANDGLDFRITLVLTSSTTVVDKTTTIMLALQQSAGGPAYYFTWRVYV